MTRIDGTRWRGTRGAPLDRFFRHVVADGDCWTWTGAVSNGYGRFQARSGRCVIAHRWIYQQLVGDVPEGLHLDHLCRNTVCVNPYHLDPVPPLVNVQRSEGNNSKTHCPQGHAYDEANTDRRSGRRFCRACRADRVNHIRPEQHGTVTGYVYGCRCDGCKRAQRAYDAERRARKAAA